MIIYKATNKVNGKVYIGQTIMSLKRRIKSHKDFAASNRNQTHFSLALNKYGIDTFRWDIIDSSAKTKDELNILEIHYISLFNATDRTKGYNLSIGGNGTSGYKLTEEQKEKSKNTWFKKGHSVWNKNIKGIHLSIDSEFKDGNVPWNKGLNGMHNSPSTEFPSQRIRCIETNEVFDSISECCRKYNLSSGNVCSVLNGKRNHTHNLTFERCY